MKVQLVQENVLLSAEHLKKLAHFHMFGFREVLRLEKYPMMFDPTGSDMGFFVVPLRDASAASDGGVDADITSADYFLIFEIFMLNFEISQPSLILEEREI